MSFKDFLYDLATDKTRGPLAGALKVLLLLLSLLYGSVVCILIFVSGLRKVRLACRVISVGNVTLGGTGKTVMVELIADYLKKSGRNVAVLSRGYKKPGSVWAKAPDSYESMGDEPFMLSQKLKDVRVLVGADRVCSAKAAASRYGADTVVLDDGLQQWRIRKDLEIVMLDGANPFGNRRLLPRGILRQPLYTLKYVDVFVVTNAGKADLRSIQDFLLGLNPRAMLLTGEHVYRGIYRLSRKDEIKAVDYLLGQSAALFCGLGNPGSFRNLAAKAGIKETLFFEFPDHYRYSEENIEKMFLECRRKGVSVLVTTEKDAVRIPLAARKRFGENIFILEIALKLKDEDQRFFNRLQHIYLA